MYRVFVAQEMKRMMEYRGDFFIGVAGVLLTQAFNILFLWIIFRQIPTLNGWTLNQIALIYGFSLIPKGLDHLFFDNLWPLGYWIVKNGDFDKYLTRPLSPLFHVMIERFMVDAFGELIVGILLLCSTIGTIGIIWTPLKIALFIIVIPFATMIYTAIKIGTAAIAFWIKQSGNIIYMFYMVNDFAKYPTTIYNGLIKWVITFIIPFAFTAYYPANYFLTGDNPLFNIGGTVIISIVFLIVSLVMWNRGILAYESSGS